MFERLWDLFAQHKGDRRVAICLERQLDIYAQRAPTPAPTVIFIHGGGWVRGTKDASVLRVSATKPWRSVRCSARPRGAR